MRTQGIQKQGLPGHESLVFEMNCPYIRPYFYIFLWLAVDPLQMKQKTPPEGDVEVCISAMIFFL
jgi:hypothetical protein